MAIQHLKDYFYSTQIRPLLNLCIQDYKARWKDTEKTLVKDPPIQAEVGNMEVDQVINQKSHD